MYKLKKDGLVRIVTTEEQAERWRSLGYREIGQAPEKEPAATQEPGGQNAADPLASMEAEALKALAAEKNIDIGNATSKNGILKKIRDALPLESAADGR